MSFNLIHAKCGSRVRQQLVCIKEDIPVERSDLVKGYQFEKDQYVIFTPDELKALDEKGSGEIALTEFVKGDQIDPVYYDKAYYLVPDKRGAKPYALLVQAMRKSGLTALGRWVSRGKQHLIQLRPFDEAIVMQQLLYADEVREVQELTIEKSTVSGTELELALKLLKEHTAERFQPEQYEDEVKARIEAAVEKKVGGQKISVSPAADRKAGGEVIDLVAALRDSLRAGAVADKRTTARTRKPPKKAAIEQAPARKATAR